MSIHTAQPGQRAHVQACGDIDHDFDGEVTRVDVDNFLIFVREDDTDQVWGVPASFVT